MSTAPLVVITYAPRRSSDTGRSLQHVCFVQGHIQFCHVTAPHQRSPQYVRILAQADPGFGQGGPEKVSQNFSIEICLLLQVVMVIVYGKQWSGRTRSRI